MSNKYKNLFGQLANSNTHVVLHLVTLFWNKLYFTPKLKVEVLFKIMELCTIYSELFYKIDSLMTKLTNQYSTLHFKIQFLKENTLDKCVRGSNISELSLITKELLPELISYSNRVEIKIQLRL